MAEELKELQCRTSGKEKRQTADKSTAIQSAIDDKTFRSMIADIEQELESAYHHIQILEEQCATLDHEDRERNYLREKVVWSLFSLRCVEELTGADTERSESQNANMDRIGSHIGRRDERRRLASSFGNARGAKNGRRARGYEMSSWWCTATVRAILSKNNVV